MGHLSTDFGGPQAIYPGLAAGVSTRHQQPAGTN